MKKGEGDDPVPKKPKKTKAEVQEAKLLKLKIKEEEEKSRWRWFEMASVFSSPRKLAFIRLKFSSALHNSDLKKKVMNS